MRDDSFRSSGLRVGRLFDIDIWVHWILLLIIALKLFDILLKEDQQYGEPLLAFASFALALLLTILLHEFGHAYAAAKVGGRTEKIILWPLGGLAVCEAPQEPRSQFWVAAGGPIVNLGLGLVVTGICIAIGLDFLPSFSGEVIFWQRLLQYLFLWNFVLLLVNLLPCYPLDGGRILHCWLWNRMDSHHGALELTLRISRLTAIVALIFGGATIVLGFTDEGWRFRHPFLDELGFVSAFCGLLYFLTSRQIREQVLYETEDSGAFGHDFSAGYTSLDGASPAGRRPGFFERWKLKRQQRQEDKKEQGEARDRERLDGLLEKIHKEGMGSLSPKERRFLESASKKLRKTP